MSKLNKKLISKKGAISAVALLVAMGIFGGATLYTLNGFSEGHEETTIGVGSELNAIIPDPNVYVPVTHAAIPIIESTNIRDTVVLEGESVSFNMKASIRDNGSLSYRWMQRREGNFHYQEVGSGETLTYIPSPGTYYLYGEAINTNNNVNGEQTAASKTPEVSIIVLSKAQTPTITGVHSFTTQFHTENKSYKATAAVNDGGTLTYKWYQSQNVSGTNPVLVSSADTLTLNKPNVGIYYYFVEVTNKVTYEAFGRESSSTGKSNIMTLEVVKHATAPTLTTIGHAVVSSGTAHTFSTQATINDGGKLSYKWYENTVNSRTGAQHMYSNTGNSMTITLATDSSKQVIQKFYFVDVTNTLEFIDSKGTVHTSSATSQSNIARLEVFPKADEPSIGAISDVITSTSNATVNASASVTDGGALTYEWFETATKVNTGGTKVSTGSTLSLSGLAIGPKYYYVKVSNSKPYTSVSGIVYPNITVKHSNAVRVERIGEAQTPTLSSLTDKVVVSATPVTYSITANKTDAGTLSYKWFEHTANAYAGTVKSTIGSSYSFTPTISTGSMTRYYYVEATNTLHFKDSVGVTHTSSKTSRSNIARVEVYAPAAVPVVDFIADQNVKVANATINANASVADSGTLSYQWYKTDNSTSFTGTVFGVPGKTATISNMEIGPQYYYVTVTNSKPYTSLSGVVYENKSTANSRIVRIERIQVAQKPVVGTLSNKVVESGQKFSYDSAASVTDGGTLTYTWYEKNSLSDSGKTVGTTPSIEITASAINGVWTVKYYQVEVINTFTYTDATGFKHITTEQTVSNTARVETYPFAETPSIGVLPNKVIRSGNAYTYNSNATVGDGGILTYKWYENTTNAYGGTQVGTSRDYTGNLTAPTSNIVRYVWVEVENTKIYTDLSGTSYTTKKTARSNISRLEIFTPAMAPILQVIPNQEISRINTTISVSASVTDGGSITYQWFKNTTNSNSGGTAISGATSNNVSVDNLPIGANYYYVVVTNSKPYTAVDGTIHQNTTSTTSNAVRIEVIVIAKEPVVGTLLNKVTESGKSVQFDTDAYTVDDGVLTYEWFLADTNSYSGTKMGSTDSFSKTFTTGLTASKQYFYVTVTNTLNFRDSTGKLHLTTASKKSNIAVLEVYPNAALPAIDTLADQTLKVDNGTITVSAMVSDEGTLSYEWFKTTTKVASGGAAVGSNSKTLNLSNLPIGPHYYYVRVTNTKGYVALDGKTYNATAFALSNPVRVERIQVAVKPTVGTLSSFVFPSGTGTTFNSGASKTDSGVLSYKWFENTSNTYAGTSVGTSATYSVTKTTTSDAVVRYYWVEVTNTLSFTDSTGAVHATTDSVRSNIARVETYAIAKTPVITSIPDQVILTANATVTASVVTGDGGTVTYKWFKTTTKTNTGGTLIGGNSATLSLTNLPLGPTYYYVEVENSKPYTSLSGTVYPNKETAKSNAFRIEFVPTAVNPKLGTIENKVIESGNTVTFDIGASVTDAGVLSYKWYEHTSNAYAGTVVSTTPNYSKTQTTGSTASVKYVWVEVTNTLNFKDSVGVTKTTTATVRSNIARVEIYPNAVLPTVTPLTDQTIQISTATTTVTASVTDGGTLSYEWFKPTTKVASGGTAVGGNNKTLSLTNIPVGPHYYYVKVTNTKNYVGMDGKTYSAVAHSLSNAIRIERVQVAEKPVLGTLSSHVFPSGTGTTFNASATKSDVGTLSYKWYQHDSASYSGIEVGSSSTYSVAKTTTTAPIIFYYWVEVVNTLSYTDSVGENHITTAVERSNIARVETFAIAQTPNVSAISDQVVTTSTASAVVTSSVGDAGTLSYQWFKTTSKTNTGGTAIGTNSATLSLTSLPMGPTYYYVEVTNNKPYTSLSGTVYPNARSNKSNSFRVERVPAAATPTVGTLTHKVVESGNSISYVSGASVTDGGNLTYKWYENTSNAYGGTVVSTSSTYSKTYTTGSTASVKYVWIEVLNTLNFTDSMGVIKTTTASARSNIARVEVYPKATVPSIGLIDDLNINGTSISVTATVQNNDGGVLSYKWFKVTSKVNTGGTIVSGNTTNTLSVSGIDFGATYYYLEVVNTKAYTAVDTTIYTSTAVSKSNAFRVERIREAVLPVIQPITGGVFESGTELSLSAIVSDVGEGVLTYKWYKNTTSAYSGTVVGTSNSYNETLTVTTGPVIAYYYVNVLNTYEYTDAEGVKHTSTKTANSNIVKVETFQKASTPTIGTLANKVLISGEGADYNAGASVSGTGVLTYKWYENTTNAYSGTYKSNTSTYNPIWNITSPTTRYYWVEVTNTVAYTSSTGDIYHSKSVARSNIARLEVYPKATAPIIGAIENQFHEGNSINTSLVATVTGHNGVLSYEWYKTSSAVTTGGTKVGTSSTLTLNGLVGGTYFYYVKVINTYTYTSMGGQVYNHSNSAISNAVTIDVVKQAQAPVLTNIANRVVLSGTAVTLNPSATSPDGGTLTYKWFENTVNQTGGTQVSTVSAYTVTKSTTTTPVIRYYSVIVTNTVTVTDSKGTQHITTNEKTSNVVSVETYPAAKAPTISAISSQTIPGTATTVTATASVTDGGTLSYQWYKTTTATTTGGTLVGSASTLNLTGIVEGPHYYYVKVTNTKTYTSLSGTAYPHSVSANSNSVRIERIHTAVAPVVGTLSNKILATNVGFTFDSAASVSDNGTLTYKWYESTTNAYSGTVVGTSSTYMAKMTVTAPIVRYYYVEVTNSFSYTDEAGTSHPTTASTKSNIARVEFYPIATTPTVGALDSKVLKTGTAFSWTPTVSGHNGTLSYQWYENTVNTTGGTASGTTGSFSKTLTAPTSTVIRYYSVLVTNTYTFTSIDGTVFTTTGTKWSNVASVEVYIAATTPTVAALGHQVRESGINASWTASVSGHNGTLSYQWYENTSNATGGTALGTATSQSRSHTTTSNLTRYISVRVINTYTYTALSGTTYTDTQTVWSNVARFEVYPSAQTPSIPTISSQNVTGTTATITANPTVTDGGALTYQWFNTTTATTTGGTSVGTSKTLSLTGLTVGPKYYYVTVTNTTTYTSVSGTIYTDTATANSNSVRIERIQLAGTPTVGALANQVLKTGVGYTYNANAASPDGGTLSYKWYEHTSNAYAGTVVGTSSTFEAKKTVTTPTTLYYYVEVTNNLTYTDAAGATHPTTSSVKSNIARVEYYPVATAPVVGTLSNVVVKSGVAYSWSASVTGHNGTLSYAWYENTTNATGGTIVGSGSSHGSITTTSSVVRKYYSVLITNTYSYTSLDGGTHTTTSTKWSNVVSLEVYPAATTPSIGALAHQVVKSGVNASWTASVSGQNGTLSYQWYENTTNTTGGTALGTASTQSRNHSTSTNLTRYISVRVINTYTYTALSGSTYTDTQTAWSNVARLEVYPSVTTPVIGTISDIWFQTNSATVNIPTNVTGHNGTLSYQWYQTTSKTTTGGTLVGVSPNLIRNGLTPGIYYYYVIVTNTLNYTDVNGVVYPQTATTRSNSVTVDVVRVAVQPNPVSLTDRVIQSGDSTEFTTNGTSDNGILTYRWFENTANAFGGTLVSTSSSLTVNKTVTTGNLIRYYSVEITNRVNHTDSRGVITTTTAVRNSNVAKVEVYPAAKEPVISNISDLINGTLNKSIAVNASSPDGGVLTYEWYKTTTKTNTGGEKQPGTTNTLTVSNQTLGVPEYYYVVITNTTKYTSSTGVIYDNKTSKKSNAFMVMTIPVAQAPVVSTLSSQIVLYGETGNNIATTASVSGGGTLSYKWYRNTVNSITGATLISGAATNSYLYNYFSEVSYLEDVHRVFFFVEVTNSYSYTDSLGIARNTTAMTRSNIACFEILPGNASQTSAAYPLLNSLGDKIVKSGESITFTPTLSSYVFNNMSKDLPDWGKGTLSYQWYEGTTSNPTTLVSSGNTYTTSFNTSTPIVRYVRVIATNRFTYVSPVSGLSLTTEDSSQSISKIEVYPVATVPTIGSIGHRVVTSGTAVTFSSSVTGQNGVLSYQWYENSSNATGGTALGTAATQARTLTTTSTLTRYYSVKVRNTYNYTAQNGTVFTDFKEAWSNVIRLEVYAIAQNPQVGNISNQTMLPPGNTSITATASVSDGGTLSYKWFQTTSATTTGGTLVGGNSATLSLTNLPVGNSYFYVEVTNSKPFTSLSGTVYPNTAITKSNSVTISVLLTAQTPVIGTLQNLVLPSGDASSSFTIGATVTDGGTLTYKWYENTTNAVGGSVVGTGSTYNPTKTVTAVTVRYYFVEVTNTISFTDAQGRVLTDTAMVRSNIARVETYPLATTPSVHLKEAYKDYYDGRFSGNNGGTVVNVTGTSEANPYGGTTYKLTKTGTANQWHGAQHAIGGLTLNAGDKLVVSGYYKTNSTINTSFDTPGFFVAGWNGSYVDRYTIESSNLGIVANNQWNYYEIVIKITSQIPSDAIFSMVNWGYSTSAGTMYIGNMSFAHIPSTNNASYGIASGDTHTLYAGVTDHNGTLSYKWYEHTSNAYGGTLSSSTQSLGIGKTVTTLTTHFYWVEVTNTLSYTSISGTVYTNSKSTKSAIARVQFYPVATTPTIANLAGQVRESGTSASWTATVTGHNGTLSYQWYENTSNATGGTELGTSASQSRTHTTSTPMSRFISVKVVNTLSVTLGDGKIITTTGERWSNVARLEVYPKATTPTVVIPPPINAVVGANATFTSTVTGHNGTLSYQWYENASNAVGGTARGTGVSQIISNSSVVTTYISLRVINTYSYTSASGTVHTSTATGWSNLSTFKSYAVATRPTISLVSNINTYDGAFSATASVSGHNGTLTYSWNNGGGTSATISQTGLGLAEYSYTVTVTNSLTSNGISSSASNSATVSVSSRYAFLAANDGLNMNVRSGPSTGHSIVGGYKAGERVSHIYTLSTTKGGWHYIRLANGVTGYVENTSTSVNIDTLTIVTASTPKRTTTTGLNLRDSAPSGSVLISMPSGATPYVIPGTYTGWTRLLYISGSTWYVGWSSNTFLR